jgi:hypothetical protein
MVRVQLNPGSYESSYMGPVTDACETEASRFRQHMCPGGRLLNVGKFPLTSCIPE